MDSIFARKVLLGDGWANNVRLVIDDISVARIERGVVPQDSDEIAGIVIPGLTNAHSHAFQRALVGRTEEAGPRDQDNFWSWRSRMYHLASRIDAEAMKGIARQLYTEMLAAGYTSVAEFHYLHGHPGPEVAGDMFEALLEAARDSGIRLTYVPVLYERAGFEASGPQPEQRGFTTTPAELEAHFWRARERAGGLVSVGIGAHSLRAVTERGLEHIVALARAENVPMHLHIAEQQLEVKHCLAMLGARPVSWLMRKFELDGSWCLVHATHIDEEETEALASSGAVVCLCPSTEGNLGDGLFPLAPFLAYGGRLAIGSDSHVSIDPFEELRWLEYGQRLVLQRRNVAAIGDAHSGRVLFERVLAGGNIAAGRADGAITEGGHADLVVLDQDDPMLAGHSEHSLLDALVFSGFRLPIDRVMTAGEWRVSGGRHVDSNHARDEFLKTIDRLYSGQATVQ